eukprot:CAMPEP_0203762146 /NCGR_PEP_ID=MMETSP0098-20131031/15093_1 /ASSEMBLY_ACC=CAM_ASM_000208 /TAXON_ID=96639 /ORGANISM=" , Strain NY0313808BC1" /LENGTH=906 /DNA_ID=CAMNT_0050656437 /DNA_START=90 /DNA_END=2809 /DNA_ORIENTATION=+
MTEEGSVGTLDLDDPFLDDDVAREFLNNVDRFITGVSGECWGQVDKALTNISWLLDQTAECSGLGESAPGVQVIEDTVKTKFRTFGLIDHLEHNLIEFSKNILVQSQNADCWEVGKCRFSTVFLTVALMAKLQGWKGKHSKLQQGVESIAQFLAISNYQTSACDGPFVAALLETVPKAEVCTSDILPMLSLLSAEGSYQFDDHGENRALPSTLEVVIVPWLKAYIGHLLGGTDSTFNRADKLSLDVHVCHALSGATMFAQSREVEVDNKKEHVRELISRFNPWKAQLEDRGDDSSDREPVCENPDGTIDADAMFTILNRLPTLPKKRTLSTFSSPQIVSIGAFSIIDFWIKQLQEVGVQSGTYSSVPIITAYCFRVFEQICLNNASWCLRFSNSLKDHTLPVACVEVQAQVRRAQKTGSMLSDTASHHSVSALFAYNYKVERRHIKQIAEYRSLIEDTAVEAISIETIRILDGICSLDASLAPALVEKVKAFVVDDNMQDIRHTNSPFHSCTFIAGVDFLLSNGEALVLDTKPVCEYLFAYHLYEYQGDPMFAHCLFDMCMRHKKKLHDNGTFQRFFPSIFQCAIRHALARCGDLVDLLPAILDNCSFEEVLHAILDLPLLAFSLEYQDRDEANSNEDQTDRDMLFAILKRKQSYSAYPLESRSIAGTPCYYLSKTGLINEARVVGSNEITPRVRVACETSVSLLERYLLVLAHHAGIEVVSTIVPLMLQRRSYLFGPPEYISQVGSRMFGHTNDLCEMFPELVSRLEPFFVAVLSSSVSMFPTIISQANIELAMHMCILVGRALERSPKENFDNFFQAIVLNLHDLSTPSLSSHGFVSSKSFCTKYMLTAISTIERFGIHVTHLKVSAKSCLAKILEVIDENEVDLMVVDRIHEAIRRIEKAAFV